MIGSAVFCNVFTNHDYNIVQMRFNDTVLHAINNELMAGNDYSVKADDRGPTTVFDSARRRFYRVSDANPFYIRVEVRLDDSFRRFFFVFFLKYFSRSFYSILKTV